jgi:hypothetical protein
MNCFGCLLLVICAATSWSQTSTGPNVGKLNTTSPLMHNIIEYQCRWFGLSSNANRIGGRVQFPPKAQPA